MFAVWFKDGTREDLHNVRAFYFNSDSVVFCKELSDYNCCVSVTFPLSRISCVIPIINGLDRS